MFNWKVGDDEFGKGDVGNRGSVRFGLGLSNSDGLFFFFRLGNGLEWGDELREMDKEMNI